jgi:general secretion pathway protein N
MKRWLVGLVVGVLALAVLVWFLPASWALPWLQAQRRGWHLDDVSGTLWQGRAGQVSLANGTPLGSLDWTLSHRALLGDIRMGFDLRQPQLQLQAHVHRISPTQIELHDVSLHMNMALLDPQPWLRGQPQGQLDLQIPQAQLQGNWPMQLDAHGTWSHAAVQTPQGKLPLGALSLAITGESGVIQGTLSDDGKGPLQTAGRLSLSPLGWDLQLRLIPRSDNPALMSWLRSLGPLKADGTLELRYRGGLAQWNPAAKR